MTVAIGLVDVVVTLLLIRLDDNVLGVKPFTNDSSEVRVEPLTWLFKELRAVSVSELGRELSLGKRELDSWISGRFPVVG